MISDLCEVLPAPAGEHAKRLHDVWQANWRQLRDDEASVDRVSAEIDHTRTAIREILRRLH